MTFDDPDLLPPLDAEDEARRRRTIFALVGSFLLALLAIVTVQWITDSDTELEGTGEPLPSLTFTTLDGAEFALARLEGQPAVLNFFASWCAPCRAEMPDFEKVHLAHRGEVQFVGVNTRETNLDDAMDVVETTGVTYTILLGDDGGEGSLYQSISDLGVMPTTAFIATDGTVIDVHAGILTAEDLERRIAELFD
jgi:cytochrome c biogenesis protein CcmG/thiol:disulfide interchange protein DsbE